MVGIMLLWVCFGADASGGAQYTESDLTKNIIEILDLIFGLLALVLWPMVILAGWLLSPDWTMGDFFGLRGYFKEVWILVANIVYIIFALMLLYMAIMQIFWGAESEYAFKKKLPSFLVGILLVPFTWLIVSWTLSFANQAVAAVLSIPMGSIAKLDTGWFWEQSTSMWHKKMLPTQFDFSPNSSGYGETANMACENGYLKDNGSVACISPAEFLTQNQAWPFFIIMIYAYNIFKIQDADINHVKDFCAKENSDGTTQYQSAKSCVESLVSVVRKFWLSLVVTVFFAIMLIALCWILLMRAIKLWIYIMLSPLFGLAYFTGKGMSEWVWEGWEMGFWWIGFKPFFKLAMVPVLVSAVLAFWLLFVGVVRDNFHGGTKNPNQTEFCTDDKVGYMVTYCIQEIKEWTETKFTSKLIIGTDTTNDGKDSRITLNFGDAFSNIIGWAEGASIASGAVAGGISSVEDIFAHIILTMMALVFMFMGVKIAANYDPVTEAAFKPFAELGKSVGNFVAHSPSYLPLPHPAFQIANPDFYKAISKGINQSVSQTVMDRQSTILDGFDNTINHAKTVAQDPNTTPGEKAATFWELPNDKIALHTKDITLPALKTTLSQMTKWDTSLRDKLLKELESTKENHQALQSFLKTNKDDIEKLVAENGDQGRSLQAIVEKVIGSNLWSAETNVRHMKLVTSGKEVEIIRETSGGYKIESVDSTIPSFTMPKLSSGVTPPNEDIKKNEGYKDIQKQLSVSWSPEILSKSNVDKYFPWQHTEEEYTAFQTYFGFQKKQ